MAVHAPNGFFYNNMLWYDMPRGDALLVKGYQLDMLDLSGANVDVLNSFHHTASNLFFALPDGLHMQSQWTVTSDYREELSRFSGHTQQFAENRWTRFNRDELYHRYTEQQKQGILRRESHVLWFTKRITSPLSKVLSTARAVTRNLETIVAREAGAFDNLTRTLQQNFGGYATVRPMNDEENFLNYRNFLNPSLLTQSKEKALGEFDREASIQDLVFRSDGIHIDSEDASFHFAGKYHTIFVVSRWPAQVRPMDVLSITNLPFNDYCITTNLIPKNTYEEIAKEEKAAQRIAGDLASSHHLSLEASLDKKKKKIRDLSRGYTRLYSTLQVVRVWANTLDELITKSEAMKAAISDMGAQYYAVSRHATAQNLFFQTWPGNTHEKYRGHDLEASNAALACLVPFTSTFTGAMDKPDAIFHGATRNLVGVRTFAGSTPQHALVIGGTGAGKSVFMNALLTQTECDYTRTVIIEEGFSYSTYTQTLGVRPIVLQLDGELTLNYLDTNGLPLSHHHVGTAAALCLKMVGYSSDEDVNKQRLGQLGEYINQLYFDSSNDWLMTNEDRVPELQRLGYTLEAFRQKGMPANSTFLDTYVAFRDQARIEREEPHEAKALKKHTAEWLAEASEDDVVEWAKTRDGERIVRDLVFSEYEHEDYATLTHGTLYQTLRYGRMSHHKEDEINYLADMLAAWTRDIGQRGKFFDGISNIDLSAKVLHFELSLIPESAKDFKEAAGFLLNNSIRHAIMTDPRKWKKRIIFEEAPRFFGVPGGDEIVSAAYATYRKYNTWLVTVCQQISQIPAAIRPVLVGNSQVKFIFRQKSTTDLNVLGNEMKLPSATVQTIRDYPSPEHLPRGDRYSSLTYWAEEGNRPINGTIRVYASPEMLYCSSTDGDVFEERAAALSNYNDVTDGIIAEVAMKQQQGIQQQAA